MEDERSARDKKNRKNKQQHRAVQLRKRGMKGRLREERKKATEDDFRSYQYFDDSDD